MRRPPARLAVAALERRDVPTATVVDYTFGTDGRTALPGLSTVADLALTPDGHIIAVGQVIPAGSDPLNAHPDFGVVRLTADGQPDPAFGTGGLTVIPFDLNDYPSEVAVMPDGRVVVAGTAAPAYSPDPTAPQPRVAVARLTPDGKLDPTFGDGGKATFALGRQILNDTPRNLAALPSGTVYILSSSGSLAARLTPAG